MDSPQFSFRFRFRAPNVGGKIRPIEKRTEIHRDPPRGLPSWATCLDDILALAQRTPGWNNRTCPPQRVTLSGGCQLFVVPAHLWRPRSCVRREPVCAPIPFPQRMRKAC